MRSLLPCIGALVMAAGLLAGCGNAAGPQRARAAAAVGAAQVAGGRSQVGHIFVINMENKGFTRTWGSHSKAPYVARTLRRKGVLLTRYYGTAHHSEGNYIAQVSGQGPNPEMQKDCRTYSNLHTRRVGAWQQRIGHGCIFGKHTPTLMKQMDYGHRGSWRGYMQDMGRACRHPKPGHRDNAFTATRTRQYATRHNPFVYFHSVINHPGYCRSHVVGLGSLSHDLKRVRTTRTLTYISPDLCSDGHDNPCKDGRRGGLVAFNRWAKAWVPKILASPAFKRNGMLVITADESDGPRSDSSACCGERSVNVRRAGVDGPGGGRIGALVISRFTRPGTSTGRTYNHYSLLGTMERIIGARLYGYARTPHLHLFGADVFNR
ncbi:MAG: alkaline phosphatase family protein [Marmoricola sp.]